ncbi:uncharacterized protein EI97DRAFT_196094 [Westerdykella ornata]|uniref:Rhodopsin domain-containing protein n=1 Tax=Westerdykella ornata TaxID=318751 RepID=A0A6A6J9X7_WESOR|nr:uncharacterized protein EI97DRAFT_196094 [Westerdykella ornata]KAF2272788.1 hypothetical protein EI97DRAFT_196094 [Westerdykella ornata]
MGAHSQQGALPPPEGVVPDVNLSHNEHRTTYMAALALMLIFPSTLVPLRLYTKAVIMKSLRTTDVTCLIGFVNFIALVTLGYTFPNVGMGKHAWDIPLASYSRLAELLNIQQAVYMPAILFTKLAILLQLVDIFVPTQLPKNSRWYSLYSLIASNVLFFTVLMFVEIFQCVPRQKIWNPTLHGRCIDINKTFIATGVINVIDDFIILIIPLVWTWKLQLRLKQKVGVSAIFATGFFACITSVMRLIESIKSLDNPDISHSLLPVSLWALAEVSAGLVVCCLPLLPRLFGHRNARTRLAVSEPSGHSALVRKVKSQFHGFGSQSGVSLNSEPVTSFELRSMP